MIKLSSILTFSLICVGLVTYFITRPQIPGEFKELMVKPAHAHEIEEEFICPCCGDLVADCTCGMAVDRRAYIEDLIADGYDKLEIFQSYANKYDLSEFKDDELKNTVTKYIETTAPEVRPIIKISEDTREIGDLVQADYKEGERYELEYEVKNVGDEDLIINNIDSSCMCTKAKLISEGQESPELGMNHGDTSNIQSWEIVIKPGESAILKVYYDPNAHGEFSGEITRTVTLKSNDPINSKISVKFELNQI